MHSWALTNTNVFGTFVSLTLFLFRYADSAEEHTNGEEEAEPVDILSFFVFSVVLGVATYHLLAFTRVPYTALLLVWGVVLGVAVETFAEHWKLLGPGTLAWERIDPELLLSAFLPVLLFAGAFALQWHIVRKLIWSSLLLAGPGVLFGAALLAVLVKYTFPYDWSWVECLLFGAVFSATDPVAVVAVLKEAGLDTRLRTLVDSEALINDGTAYVLFYLLRNWAEGERQTVGDSIKLFCQLSLGGPATGLAFGLATTVWLRFMYNNFLAEITLTIAAAFATYLVADQLFSVSGVLAVVVLGTWMAAKGRARISVKVQEPLTIIWEELEYLANTLIFVLAGVIIAGNIYTSSVSGPSHIEGLDYVYALLLWVYLLVIRVLMFVLGWPLLTRMGYGLTFKQAIVLSWSGLRGAVGLALSLFVLLDDQIADRSFRVLTFFYMGAQAFLTLVLQGTSMPQLLRLLGMTKPPSVRRAFLHHVLRTTEEHGERQLGFAQGDKVLGEPHWPLVRQLTNLDTASLLRRYVSRINLSTGAFPHLDLGDYEKRVALQMDRTARLSESRARIINAVRQTYHDFLHDNYITGPQLFHLQDSANRAADRLHLPLCDWRVLRDACGIPQWIKHLLRFGKGRLLGPHIMRLLFQRLEHSATLALAFCHAHELAVQDMAKYGTLAGWDEEQEREQAEAARLGVHVHLDDLLDQMKDNALQQVVRESRAERQEALQYIAAVKAAFPEVLQALKTLQLAQEMLMFKEAYLSEIGKTGLVDEVEMEQLQSLVDRKLKRLHFSPPRLPHQSPAAALAAHPLFADVPAASFDAQVLRYARLCLYEAGEAIPLTGLRGTRRVLVVLRGSIALSSLLRPEAAAGQGAVLGTWPGLLNEPRLFQLSAAGCAALLCALPVSAFKGLMAQYSSVNDAAWRACGVSLALVHGGEALARLDYDTLTALFRQASVEITAAGSVLRTAGPALLVSGMLEQLKDKSESSASFQGPCLLPAPPAVYTCACKCRVLHLPPGFDDNAGARLSCARPHLLPGYTSAWAAQEQMQHRSMGPHMPERLRDRLSRPTLHAMLSTLSMPGRNAPPAGGAVPQASGAPDGSVHAAEAAAAPVPAAADLSPRSSAPEQDWPQLVRRRNLAYGLNMDGLGMEPRSDSSIAPAARPAEPGWHVGNAHTVGNASGARMLRELRSVPQGLWPPLVPPHAPALPASSSAFAARSHDGAATVSGATGPSLFSEWTAHHQRLHGRDTPRAPVQSDVDAASHQGGSAQATVQSGPSLTEPQPDVTPGSVNLRMPAVDSLSLELSKARTASLDASGSTLDHATASALRHEWLQYLAES